MGIFFKGTILPTYRVSIIATSKRDTIPAFIRGLPASC